MERKPWTEQEDFALKALVDQIGLSNWTLVGVKLSKACPGSDRAGKQCRERWLNHLDLKISKKPWLKSEQKIIFQMHNALGNKWTEIAKHLKARTQNDIKNHFYATMRKGIRRMNKLIGFKKDPSSIRRIKPTVISKVCQQQKKIEVQSAQKLEIQGVFNLILKLSTCDTNVEKFQEYLQNQKLIEAAECFLGKLLQENQLYQQSKQKKKQQRKSRRASTMEVKSEQMNCGLDISEYLCLGLELSDADQLRPKSQGASIKSSQYRSQFDSDFIYSSEKDQTIRYQTR